MIYKIVCHFMHVPNKKIEELKQAFIFVLCPLNKNYFLIVVISDQYMPPTMPNL